MSILDASVQRWRPLLEANAGELDVDKLLAWIAEESDGDSYETGASYEVGIFQLDLQDGPAWGATIAELHQHYEDLDDAGKALQVTSGLAYVRHARSVALAQLDAQGLAWSDDDTWCLTKLQHGLPGLPAWFLAAAAKANSADDWDAFRSFVDGCTLAQAQQIAPPAKTSTAKYFDEFGKILDNAEAVGHAGSSLLGSGGASSLVIVVALLAGAALLAHVIA